MREYLPLTLGDTLEDNASRFCDQPAYVMEGQLLTHGQLLTGAKKIASALEKAGVRRQDRIGIVSMNSLPFTQIMAAGQWSGIIVATVNFRLAPPEMAYIINDSTPRVLFFEAQYLPIIDQLRDQLPSVEIFVCIGDSTDWSIGFEQLLACGDDEGSTFTAREDDIACLIYTLSLIHI